jgi:hypothetical protein
MATARSLQHVLWPAVCVFRLSVSDKKGNTLMEPIHRWLVREQSTTQAGAGGKPQVMEGKLRWKCVQRGYNPATIQQSTPIQFGSPPKPNLMC